MAESRGGRTLSEVRIFLSSLVESLYQILYLFSTFALAFKARSTCGLHCQRQLLGKSTSDEGAPFVETTPKTNAYL
jgi:hypothetical protein